MYYTQNVYLMINVVCDHRVTILTTCLVYRMSENNAEKIFKLFHVQLGYHHFYYK